MGAGENPSRGSVTSEGNNSQLSVGSIFGTYLDSPRTRGLVRDRVGGIPGVGDGSVQGVVENVLVW